MCNSTLCLKLFFLCKVLANQLAGFFPATGGGGGGAILNALKLAFLTLLHLMIFQIIPSKKRIDTCLTFTIFSSELVKTINERIMKVRHSIYKSAAMNMGSTPMKKVTQCLFDVAVQGSEQGMYLMEPYHT